MDAEITILHQTIRLGGHFLVHPSQDFQVRQGVHHDVHQYFEIALDRHTLAVSHQWGGRGHFRFLQEDPFHLDENDLFRLDHHNTLATNAHQAHFHIHPVEALQVQQKAQKRKNQKRARSDNELIIYVILFAGVQY